MIISEWVALYVLEVNCLTNSNLRTFDNFYSNLAQSAYRGRPNLFAYERLTKEEIKVLDSGKALEYDFSRDNKFYNDDKKEWEITTGGKNLPNGGKVYLQPDSGLHTVEETIYSQILVCIL